MSKYILNYEDLKKISKKLKSKKKKIVLCHGVFDILHYGHLLHFKDSKKRGDVLVVSVTADEFVKKSIDGPYFNHNVRAKTILEISIVDYVYISNSDSSIKVIENLKPDIYAKGLEYQSKSKDFSANLIAEKKALKKVNGKIYYSKGQVFSSSYIKKNKLDNLDDEKSNFIDRLKSKNSFYKIYNRIENFKKLRALVIGEIIIDEYIFCDPLGKSGKDPMLMFSLKDKSLFLGGSAAIANNISSFVKNVDLVSFVGENLIDKSFLRKNLKKNVQTFFVNEKNLKTVKKVKFLDKNTFNKVFGYYDFFEKNLGNINENKILKFLEKKIKNYDVIIVADYGHGLITDKISSELSKQSKKLCLNVQVNAANNGFNSLKKFKNLKFLVVNEGELRQQTKNKYDEIKKIVRDYSLKNKITEILVTQGSRGSLFYNSRNKNFTKCPAFSKQALDKVGAGDTMFAIASLFLDRSKNTDPMLLVSSLAAANSTNYFANSKILEKKDIIKSLKYTLV